jgi:hypothetical protein
VPVPESSPSLPLVLLQPAAVPEVRFASEPLANAFSEVDILALLELEFGMVNKGV